MTRCLIVLGISLLFSIPASAPAYNYRLYNPYVGPYHYYGPSYRYGPSDRENARMRRELRDQRRHGSAVRRDYEDELQTLRQRAFDNQQTSSRQACHYRTTGGLEVCDDLFPRGSTDNTECEALVVKRNPSCNESPVSALHDQ